MYIYIFVTDTLPFLVLFLSVPTLVILLEDYSQMTFELKNVGDLQLLAIKLG